tara:strand:+ start:337 stop:915 length:579 start_codon:yes stop_codon:yes gene_type:complete
MKITKQRLKQIIREELQAIAEGLGARAAAALSDLDQRTASPKPPPSMKASMLAAMAGAEKLRRPRTAGSDSGKMNMPDLMVLYRGKVPRDEVVWHAQQDSRCVSADGRPCKDFFGGEHTLEQSKARYARLTRSKDPIAVAGEEMVQHRKWPGPDLGSGDKKAFRKAFAAAKTDGHKFFWFDRGKGRKPYAVK